MTFDLCKKVIVSSNTSEHGYGDFPETKWKPMVSVEAGSKEEAAKIFKRRYRSIRLGGNFPNFLVALAK